MPTLWILSLRVPHDCNRANVEAGKNPRQGVEYNCRVAPAVSRAKTARDCKANEQTQKEDPADDNPDELVKGKD